MIDWLVEVGVGEIGLEDGKEENGVLVFLGVYGEEIYGIDFSVTRGRGWVCSKVEGSKGKREK